MRGFLHGTTLKQLMEELKMTERKKNEEYIFNLRNVSEGETIKNYRTLCEVLEIEIKDGNSKKAQLKEIERFIKLSKKGRSFVVEAIHEQPIKESITVGGSRNNLPFADDLESLLISLLLENGSIMTKSNSGFLKDLCMVNSNYYEYFADKKALSDLLKMELDHIEDWYDATNSSFKGYLETVIRKLESKKMIVHEKVVMVVFVDTNIETTRTGHTKASDLMEYDTETDRFIVKRFRPKTSVRQATDDEIRLILEIEGKILEEYKCASVQEVFFKGLVSKYYKDLTRELFNELNIKRSYKAHKIHINQSRLENYRLKQLKGAELGLTKAIVNNGVQTRVLENATKRQLKVEGVHSFNRNPKQEMRVSSDYLANTETLNFNLINIANEDNINSLKIYRAKQEDKTIEQEEFEEYVLDQLPF